MKSPTTLRIAGMALAVGAALSGCGGSSREAYLQIAPSADYDHYFYNIPGNYAATDSHQGTHQAGTSGICHAVNIGAIATGPGEHLLHQWQGLANMVAGGQLRHHATVLHVNIHLTEQRISQQATPGIVERDTGLITGCFQAQDQHCAHRF